MMWQRKLVKTEPNHCRPQKPQAGYFVKPKDELSIKHNIHFERISAAARIHFGAWRMTVFDNQLEPKLRMSEKPLQQYLAAIQEAFERDCAGDEAFLKLNFFEFTEIAV